MKSYINLLDCLGQARINRNCYYDPPSYSPNVQNQTVDFGGARWKGNPGSGWSLVGQTGQAGLDTTVNAPSFQDVLGQANTLNKSLIQANQPAITSLGQQSTDLQSRYSDLLDSIKGQGSVALNTQTLATSNELAKRGITNDSGLFQNQLAQSLLPVTQNTQSQVAQTGLAEQGDINQIAGQIAGLQAGNLPAALQSAQGIAGMTLGAQQFQQQQAQQLSEFQKQQELAGALGSLQYGNIVVPGFGGNVYNVASGKLGVPQPTPFVPSTTGGYNSGGNNTSQPASNLQSRIGGQSTTPNFSFNPNYASPSYQQNSQGGNSVLDMLNPFKNQTQQTSPFTNSPLSFLNYIGL